MVDFIFKMLELYKYLAPYERNKIEKEITIYREERRDGESETLFLDL